MENGKTTQNPNTSSPHVGPGKNLVVLSQTAPSAGRIYKLHKERIVLGSVISSDVQLQGEGVSPIHAVIELQAGVGGQVRAVIYDLASETGVFVNGKKNITAEIKTGDEITIGRFKLGFAVADADMLQLGERVQTTVEGRKLVIPEGQEIRPLIMDADRQIQEIFDYRPASKSALEVVMSWRTSILDIEHFVDQNQVSVGADRSNDFAIPPSLSADVFPFAVKNGETYSLTLDPTMKGVVQRQGQLLSLDQVRQIAGAGTPLQLGRNDFAKITIGEIDFYCSYTAAPPTLKSRPLIERDPFMLKIMGTSMALTAAFIVAALNIEIVPQIEVEELPERLATILYEPQKIPPRPKVVQAAPKVETPKEPEPKKTQKVELTPSKNVPKEVPKTIKLAEKTVSPKSGGGPAQRAQDEAKEGAGARAKGAEGTRGEKNAKANKENQQLAKRPSPQGGTGRGGGNSEVQDQGNVDLLKGAATAVQNILGNTAAKLGTGGQKLQGFGNFSTLGSGGKALSGDGQGGGGDAEGLGGLADKGRGGGRVGTGLGAAGNGSGIIGGKSRVVLRAGGEGETVVMGSIDKAAIEAAILAHRDEFRLCYEREINAEAPQIAGTVKSTFVIGSSGRVSQAGVESSSIGNANVERCVITVLKRIDFPMPEGGGVVQVTYPFKFASGK